MTQIVLAVLAGVLLAFVLAWAWRQKFSFRAQDPAFYAGQTPEFDIRDVLTGPMTGDGIIYNFAGRATARFSAVMQGTWEGNVGKLTERFAYSTGNVQNREWKLTVSDKQNFIGEAPDIVGAAVGKQCGAAVSLKYRIVLPKESGGHTIDVTDWMYLTESRTVVNHAEFRKFGIKVGGLIATFGSAA